MTVTPEGGLLYSPASIGHGAHGNAVPARVEPVKVVLVVFDADGVGLPQYRTWWPTIATKTWFIFERAISRLNPVEPNLSHLVVEAMGASGGAIVGGADLFLPSSNSTDRVLL